MGALASATGRSCRSCSYLRQQDCLQTGFHNQPSEQFIFRSEMGGIRVWSRGLAHSVPATIELGAIRNTSQHPALRVAFGVARRIPLPTLSPKGVGAAMAASTSTRDPGFANCRPNLLPLLWERVGVRGLGPRTTPHLSLSVYSEYSVVHFISRTFAPKLDLITTGFAVQGLLCRRSMSAVKNAGIAVWLQLMDQRKHTGVALTRPISSRSLT